LVAGGNEEQVSLAARIGRCLGRTYQIADDFFDIKRDKHESLVNVAGPMEARRQLTSFYTEATEASAGLPGNTQRLLGYCDYLYQQVTA
ncbi:MAG: hypothetical protein ACRD4B_11090, partial [Acidobacteriota bacterium]